MKEFILLTDSGGGVLMIATNQITACITRRLHASPAPLGTIIRCSNGVELLILETPQQVCEKIFPPIIQPIPGTSEDAFPLQATSDNSFPLQWWLMWGCGYLSAIAGFALSHWWRS